MTCQVYGLDLFFNPASRRVILLLRDAINSWCPIGMASANISIYSARSANSSKRVAFGSSDDIFQAEYNPFGSQPIRLDGITN